MTPLPFEITLDSTSSAFARMYRCRHRSVAQQLDEISRKGDVDVNDIAALPRVTLKGRTFVLEDWVHKKGQRGRKTWIKTHGIFLVEIMTNGTLKSQYWICNICDGRGTPELFAAAATSSASHHLKE